jgi:serine/threonine protein kinase
MCQPVDQEGNLLV